MVKDFGFWTARALISVFGALGLVAIYYFGIAARPPLEWHESAVSPTIVNAGDEIVIRRTFTVFRDEIVTITRTMITGDCRVECMQYDLEPSTFLITRGKYNRALPHIIPARVKPGVYTLQFEMSWKNLLGYRYAVRHPPLTIEVR